MYFDKIYRGFLQRNFVSQHGVADFVDPASVFVSGAGVFEDFVTHFALSRSLGQMFEFVVPFGIGESLRKMTTHKANIVIPYFRDTRDSSTATLHI